MLREVVLSSAWVSWRPDTPVKSELVMLPIGMI
jgi:hypothetical protein